MVTEVALASTELTLDNENIDHVDRVFIVSGNCNGTRSLRPEELR